MAPRVLGAGWIILGAPRTVKERRPTKPIFFVAPNPRPSRRQPPTSTSLLSILRHCRIDLIRPSQNPAGQVMHFLESATESNRLTADTGRLAPRSRLSQFVHALGGLQRDRYPFRLQIWYYWLFSRMKIFLASVVAQFDRDRAFSRALSSSRGFAERCSQSRGDCRFLPHAGQSGLFRNLSSRNFIPSASTSRRRPIRGSPWPRINLMVSVA